MTFQHDEEEAKRKRKRGEAFGDRISLAERAHLLKTKKRMQEEEAIGVRRGWEKLCWKLMLEKKKKHDEDVKEKVGRIDVASYPDELVEAEEEASAEVTTRTLHVV